MGKSITELKNETLKQYYPDSLPKTSDFSLGDKVKIITPCQNFHFFYGETGVITEVKEGYLGIHVVFDKPRKFHDGYVQDRFNFNPEDLFLTEQRQCPYCGHKI